MYKIIEAYEKAQYTLFGNKTTDYHGLVDFFLHFRESKRILYFIGNGGSAGIAVHMTADFMKNGGMKTYSMFNPATITCLGNDFGYEYIFSKQLESVACEGDCLVAISSSGNSLNIINGVLAAREKGCNIVTCTGFSSDNQLRKMGDYNVYIPCMKYGVVETIHNMILQKIVDDVLESQ